MREVLRPSLRRRLREGGVLDLISAWKAASIGATGAFGVLALLTEYKDKLTGKLTKWGKISLAGILLSTTCGIAAQLKEASDAEASREKLEKFNQSQIVEANATLRNVQRILTPLGKMQFQLHLQIPCTSDIVKEDCAYYAGKPLKFEDDAPYRGFFPATVEIDFYKHSTDKINGGSPAEADLSFNYTDNNDKRHQDREAGNIFDFEYDGYFKAFLLNMDFSKIGRASKNTAIVSYLDLLGSELRICVSGRDESKTLNVRISDMQIFFDNGRSLSIDKSSFQTKPEQPDCFEHILNKADIGRLSN